MLFRTESTDVHVMVRAAVVEGRHRRPVAHLPPAVDVLTVPRRDELVPHLPEPSRQEVLHRTDEEVQDRADDEEGEDQNRERDGGP